MLHNDKYVIQNNRAYVIVFAGELNAAYRVRQKYIAKKARKFRSIVTGRNRLELSYHCL
jgi:hypothetical protein